MFKTHLISLHKRAEVGKSFVAVK